ncbi:MAG: universal stress protein [Deltaproteobacteria bacterium]|nr:universal stress protein [Deltaproteobacteria bacterium]
MFKKILVPLDGSKLAAKVLTQVAELAKACKSQVTLIHVCHTEQMGEAPGSVLAAAAAQEKKVCQTFLSQAAQDLEAAGLKVDFACVEGVPPREIIGYADKNNYDLIAMATHGRGEVAWVLGSTAEKVVSHATVPVLLFRVLEFKPPMLKEEFFLP